MHPCCSKCGWYLVPVTHYPLLGCKTPPPGGGGNTNDHNDAVLHGAPPCMPRSSWPSATSAISMASWLSGWGDGEVVIGRGVGSHDFAHSLPRVLNCSLFLFFPSCFSFLVLDQLQSQMHLVRICTDRGTICRNRTGGGRGLPVLEPHPRSSSRVLPQTNSPPLTASCPHRIAHHSSSPNLDQS